MKRNFKAVVSLLLALVLFAAALPFGEISASAAETLSSDVTYKKDGTAVVELTAGDFYNAVRYTTDGSVPTSKSKYYLKPIEITEKTLIRAAEFDGDKKVKGIKLTVDPKNAPSKTEKTETSTSTVTNEKTGKVTFEVTQLGDYKAVVEIECETPGCEIRYTTDGSKPDENSELYKNGIIVTEKTRIRARAYKDGYKTVTTYGKTVNVKLFADSETKTVDTGSTSSVKETEKETENNVSVTTEPEKEAEKTVEKQNIPAEKVYDDQKISYKTTYMDDGTTRITLTPAKSGYTIRYTTDGTTPTYKTGKKYKSRLTLDEPTVLRARQYNSDGKCVGTLKLNVKIKCADVIFSCVSMETGIREIKMTCATPGVTIYYTTNGNSPKGSSAKVYSEPIFATSLADVMAYAVKDGYKDGSVTWEIAGNIKMKLDNFNFDDPQYKLGLDILNQYRRANGVSMFNLNEKLTEAANMRAYELSVLYSHRRPSGTNYTSVLSDYNITKDVSGEYIERHHNDVYSFLEEVLSNRENSRFILSDDYNYSDIGIGYYETPTTTYWVLLVIG